MSDLWKARLLPASFRGIGFKVKSHDLSGGRHNKTHEPPERDGGFTEDTGKKTPKYTVEGYILGDNYFFFRDALISAMENGNTGILIHPYLGLKIVQPETFSFKEDKDQGRICFFTLGFNDAGFPLFPSALISSALSFVNDAAGYVSAFTTVFETAYSVAQIPGFAVSSATEALENVARTVDQTINGVRKNRDPYSSLKKQTSELESGAGDVAENPEEISARITDIVDTLTELVPDEPDPTTIDTTSGRDDKLDVLRPLLTFDAGSSAIIADTPTRIAERSNLRQLENLIQGVAIVSFVERLINKDFNSIDESLTLRNEIIAAIQNQLDKDYLDDEAFNTLSSILSNVVEAVPDRTKQLNTVLKKNLLTTTPSLVLSYDLYEDLSNESDIIFRNKVRNPGFIYGEIEVLTGINTDGV